MDTLPVVVSDEFEMLEEQESARSGFTPFDGAHTDQSTVLIVEDDESIAELLADLLSDEGYRVLVANNGQEALACARREHPAMVLSDCMLPGLSGTQLAYELRRSPATRSIKIALMSSTRPRDFTLPDVPFLAKPFEIDDVVALVEHAVRVRRMEPLYGEA